MSTTKERTGVDVLIDLLAVLFIFNIISRLFASRTTRAVP